MTSFRHMSMHAARAKQADGGPSIASMNEEMASAARNENPSLGAFTHFIEDRGSAGAQPPLAGFSGAIKANIAGKGWPTHCGSLFLKDYISPYDSTAVSRLRAAGSHFLGITTMDEFGMGSSCEHTVLGQVVNPWDKSLSAGGSSGGSAAAVAAGLAWYALGSDTGGSVRLPAHFCGVVGLKPTWGRISRNGLVAFASSLDTIGILGRDTLDVFEVFSVLAGHDLYDATSLPDPLDQSPLEIPKNLQGQTIGFPRQLDSMKLDDDVSQEFEKCIQQLKDLGARVQPVAMGGILDAGAPYHVLNCAEAASNLHRFDGSLYGRRITKESYLETLEQSRTKGFGPEVKRRLLLGAHVLSGGYQKQYYLRACAARQSLVQDFHKLFAKIDLLALPTAPSTAFSLGSRLEDPLAMHSVDTLTVPASLAGLPALSFPTGLDRRGLPHSLQFIGPACSERLLLQSAGLYEKHIGFRDVKEAPWHRLP